MRAAILLAVAATGCTTGIDFATGTDASMLISGAQFFPGEPPAGDPAGPLITTITSPNNQVRPGQIGKHLGGTAQGTARAVAFYWEGDDGYWLTPVGLPDSTTPTDLDFDVRAAFARTIDAGPHQILMQATDASGGFGPQSPLTVTVTPAVPPASTLVVQLAWDAEADVDLHVTEPDGVTIWARNLNAIKPAGPGEPAGDPTQFGALDFDSNASCQIDGRREENVYWTVTPPSGHYAVKVDTWALCGQPAARWHVTATLAGQVLGQASGIGLESDTTFDKAATSGVLALEFDVP